MLYIPLTQRHTDPFYLALDGTLDIVHDYPRFGGGRQLGGGMSGDIARQRCAATPESIRERTGTQWGGGHSLCQTAGYWYLPSRSRIPSS